MARPFASDQNDGPYLIALILFFAVGVKRREYDQPPRDRYDDRRYDSYRGGGARYDSYRAPSRDDYGRDRDRDYRGGGRDRDRNRDRDRDDFGRDRDYRE